MSDWTGVIAIEGTPTGDGRLLENGALFWETLPIPLIWDRDDGDHSGLVVGTVTNIWRENNGEVRAEGTLSESQDDITRAAVMRVRELLEEGAVGVSVGLDSETVEVRADPDLLPDEEDMMAAIYAADLEHVIHIVFTDGGAGVITAALGGDSSLPVAGTDRPWSGAAARNRVFAWASNENGEVDQGKMRQAFLWQDPDADPNTKQAWKLGVADIIDGTLTIVPRGVAAAAGGRGVGSVEGLSDNNQARIEARICRLYDRIRESDAEWNQCPFDVEMVSLARMSHDDQIYAVTAGRIRHLAIVDTPAVADARIALVAAAVLEMPRPDVTVFANPNYGQSHHLDPRLAMQAPERPGETVTYGAPLLIDDDGHVSGHAALWGRCHAGFRNRCVVPPKGAEYSRFLHGEAAKGVPTGVLTVGTTHAKLEADATEAFDHYADTGRAVADVTVGEDHLGLWVSGQLRPGISERDLADLRGSSLSGDWRPVNGRYRLCGLLAVNQPGYLVQRATDNGGVITAGPCACDADDPFSVIYARLLAVEEATAVLLAAGA